MSKLITIPIDFITIEDLITQLSHIENRKFPI
jgi:hypothetical protein